MHGKIHLNKKLRGNFLKHFPLWIFLSKDFGVTMFRKWMLG